jgi:glyceraldehyde 3-phosphate dehydrogenase
MVIRIAINGFGRIGRLVYRIAIERNDIQVVAVNDLFEADYAAYLLKYDSVHGTFKHPITVTEDEIHTNHKKTKVLSISDPSNLPWKELDVDYVIESTGRFTTKLDLQKHIDAGAKRVLLTAPSKEIDVPMFVLGVNEKKYDPTKDTIISNASCTTNCLAPLSKVLNDHVGIEEGLMTTVHALTSSQPTVDGPSKKDWRGGRSALVNIIPSTTGAAKAVALCIPELKGKITGMSLRVPVIDVSCVDLTFRTTKKTSYEEICSVIRQASLSDLKGIIEYCDHPVVSSDFIGSPYSCIFDKAAGIGLNEHFFKLIAWYDNEYGYSTRVVDMIEYMKKQER